MVRIGNGQRRDAGVRPLSVYTVLTFNLQMCLILCGSDPRGDPDRAVVIRGGVQCPRPCRTVAPQSIEAGRGSRAAASHASRHQSKIHRQVVSRCSLSVQASMADSPARSLVEQAASTSDHDSALPIRLLERAVDLSLPHCDIRHAIRLQPQHVGRFLKSASSGRERISWDQPRSRHGTGNLDADRVNHTSSQQRPSL